MAFSYVFWISHISLRTLQKGARKAEKGQKTSGKGPLPGRAASHPLNPRLFMQVQRCTRSMRAPSRELWRSLAKLGVLWRMHNAIFTRTSVTFTRVPAKASTFTRVLTVGFGQNGFFADLYFWAAGFFRGFCRRIFFSEFCGEKGSEKSSRKIPGKILQN